MEKNSAELFADLFDENDDVRELTEEEFKHFKPFSDLPEEHKDRMFSMSTAAVVPTRTVHLAAEVVAKFEAKGADWERQMDHVLLEWLRDHAA